MESGFNRSEWCREQIEWYRGQIEWNNRQIDWAMKSIGWANEEIAQSRKDDRKQAEYVWSRGVLTETEMEIWGKGPGYVSTETKKEINRRRAEYRRIAKYKAEIAKYEAEIARYEKIAKAIG